MLPRFDDCRWDFRFGFLVSPPAKNRASTTSGQLLPTRQPQGDRSHLKDVVAEKCSHGTGG